jgi:hypothetical protein
MHNTLCHMVNEFWKLGCFRVCVSEWLVRTDAYLHLVLRLRMHGVIYLLSWPGQGQLCCTLSSGRFTSVCSFKCQCFGTICLFHLHTYPPMKMEQTVCSETLAFKLLMPMNHPEESVQHSEQGECLKSGTTLYCLHFFMCFKPLLALRTVWIKCFDIFRPVIQQLNQSLCNKKFCLWLATKLSQVKEPLSTLILELKTWLELSFLHYFTAGSYLKSLPL